MLLNSFLTSLTSKNNLFKKNEVDTLYVDFAKAFDKVDHQILIKKLAVYGVPKKIITWIENFITGRRQFVLLNGAKSYEAPVESICSNKKPAGSIYGKST